MILAVDNQSKIVTLAQAKQIAAALNLQMRQVAIAWGKASSTVVMLTPTTPSTARRLLIVDDPDIDGALGYHDVDQNGRPYARVFVKPTLDNGGTVLHGPDSVSVTASHEACELVGDPSANYWADAPDGCSYALELCDACEGDSYPINGVSCSNFLLPTWFEKTPESTKFDYMGKLHAPFTMDIGGYMIVEQGGSVNQVFAEHYPAWKKSKISSRRIARGAVK